MGYPFTLDHVRGGRGSFWIAESMEPGGCTGCGETPWAARRALEAQERERLGPGAEGPVKAREK